MRRQTFSLAEQQEMVDCYRAGYTLQRIADEHRSREWTVRRRFTEWGVERRHGREASPQRKQINESAFDKLTEECAYWAGFLCADAYVRPGRICLALQISDREHLIAFRRFLQSDHRIGTRDRGKAVQLQITSRRLTDALASQGFPVGPKGQAVATHLSQNRHFWRGVIDGDGSLWCDKQGRLHLALVGSRVIIHQWNTFTTALTNRRAKPFQRKTELWSLERKGHVAESIARHLYDGAHISLTRKYLIYHRYIQYPNASSMGDVDA